MTNITLKQLRYFHALARHRHFGRAAEVCAVSQPALSVQIRDLEDELGAKLVERGSRQVGLTGFGEEFLPRVSAILNAVDELGDLARARLDTLAGRFRLGVIPTIAPYLLPAFIDLVSRRHPALDLHVRETVTPGLIAELGDGRIDAAIVALPVSESALVEVPLFDEEFVLVRPGQDTGRPVPTPDELREMRLLLLEEGHCFRDQAMSFCNLPTVLARDGLDASSLSTLVQMVNSGIGVTLIPEMAIRVETRSASVAIDRFERNTPSRTIGMVWRKSSPLGKQMTEISQTVRQVCENLHKSAEFTTTGS